MRHYQKQAVLDSEKKQEVLAKLTDKLVLSLHIITTTFFLVAVLTLLK
jgi:hypothetical protein